MFDGGGHVVEVVSRAPGQASAGTSEAHSRFYSFSGGWGGYTANARDRKITFKPVGASSPNVMGTEFSRTFDMTGDRLVITSLAGEPHTQGVTRWTWERVPTVDNLSDGYRRVIGFWQHVVEKRVNVTTGALISESKRAPSVIVYTPAGYVGPFPAAEPAAIRRNRTDGGGSACRVHGLRRLFRRPRRVPEDGVPPYSRRTDADERRYAEALL